MIAPRKIMKLCCKAGEEATRDQLFDTFTPEATKSHCPVPHGRVIKAVEDAMGKDGLQIVGSEFALSDGVDYNNNKAPVPEGRMFAMYQIANGHDDRVDVIALRNSHDKSLPLSLAGGGNVFCCTNLILNGEIKVARKHTSMILRDLDQLVAMAMGKIGDSLVADANRIEAYKATELDDNRAGRLIVEGCTRYRASTKSKVDKIWGEWLEPSHDEFKPRNAWSLFNAFTEVAKGQNPENHIKRGQALHGLFDSACSVLATN
jgi:hypothetical protein